MNAFVFDIFHIPAVTQDQPVLRRYTLNCSLNSFSCCYIFGQSWNCPLDIILSRQQYLRRNQLLQLLSRFA